MNMKKNNVLKISRGYRLKQTTHSMIKSLQQLTHQDSDSVISKSCALYYKKFFEEKEKLNLNQNQRKAS